MTNISTKLEVVKASQSAPMRHFERPAKLDELSDHIKRAEKTTVPFEHVVVAGSYTRTKKSLWESIVSRKSATVVEETHLEDILPIDLVERDFTIPFTKAVPKGFFTQKKRWFLISEILIEFVPAQSFYDPYSKVEFILMDNRKIDGRESKRIITANNVGMSGFMSMGHSVHVNDVRKMGLKVRMLNSILEEGSVWGSLRVRMTVQQSDFALSVAEEEVMAVLQMTEGMLRTPKRDPYVVDTTIDQEDVKDIRKMNKQGRIRDFKRPLSKKDRISYAASEAGSFGGRSDEGEEFMGEDGEEDDNSFVGAAEPGFKSKYNPKLESRVRGYLETMSRREAEGDAALEEETYVDIMNAADEDKGEEEEVVAGPSEEKAVKGGGLAKIAKRVAFKKGRDSIIGVGKKEVDKISSKGKEKEEEDKEREEENEEEKFISGYSMGDNEGL